MCSEVAQLRQQIELQVQALQSAMYGFAITARHEFIQARYNSIGTYQNRLAEQVGERAANQIVYKVYAEVMEREPDAEPPGPAT